MDIFIQVFPKTQKLTPAPGALARQDTIDETNEDSKSLRRQAMERQTSEREGSSGTQREHMEKSSSLERETMSSSARTTSASDTYDNGLREQSSTSAQRELIATVLDMKVDSRLELQRMSQRIGRLEDLLSELVKRLSHDSSDLSTPADETIPMITTTFVGSPPTNSTAQSTNIIVTSTASSSAPIPTSSDTSIQPSPSTSGE